MTKTALSFYEITFRFPRKKNEFKVLDHLEGKEPDLINSLEKFFSTQPKFKPHQIDVTNGVVSKTLFLEKIEPIQHRQFSGVIRTGDDGFGSELFNGKNGKKEFTRKSEHVEMMPFYFLADLPKGSKKAILALQTFGVYGMGTKVTTQLKDFLRNRYSNYTVDINVIFVGDLFLDKFIKDGELHEIQATRYVMKGDCASEYENGIKCEYHISPAKRGLNFKSDIKKILNKAKHTKDKNGLHKIYKEVNSLLAVSIPDDIENMKFEISLDGGARRKIDIADTHRFATKFDVTDDVLSHDGTGHPSFDSIDKVAKDLMKKDIRGLIS